MSSSSSLSESDDSRIWHRFLGGIFHGIISLSSISSTVGDLLVQDAEIS